MAKPIAPSTSEQVQSESKVGGLLDQLRAVIRRSGLNDDQLQAIRDSGQLPTMFEPVFQQLVAIVVNVVRLTITSVKEFEKPDWMKQLVKGNDPVEPGTYEYTFEPFLLDGESPVKGDVMVQRANVSGAVSGLQHTLYLLDNQHLIPTQFEGKKYLVFAGTEALDSDDRRYLACLRHDGDSWFLYWYFLDYGFRSLGLLVRARKL
jgi:hypothetical protein